MNSKISRSVALAIVLLASTLPGSASLGGNMDSVRDDQAKMQGTLRTTNNDTYNVNEIQGQSGVVVREYVSTSGNVFGVAWQGRSHPDLRQVLGSFYDQYVQGVQAQRAKRRGHGPLLIQQPGLVIEMGGHMRALTGRVYLPQNLPAGLRAEDIR